jgi:hypothetical protein
MDKVGRTLRIACIQLKVGTNKTENVARALEKIREAKSKGAELVSLPGNHNHQLSIHLNRFYFNIILFRMFQFSLWNKILSKLCRRNSFR